ncbi:MAG TPA: DUF502 domain-containing protein [Victivallales bacterium]|nr:DUF502 domain-containing protein [Victivallales bacterium]
MSDIPELLVEKNRLKQIRNNIIAGIFIVIPVGISLWLGIIVFKMFTEWAKDLVFIFPIPETYKNSTIFIFLIRLSSLFILLGFLFAVGHLAKYAAGKKIISYADSLMLKVPMVKTVYSTISQIMDTIKASKSGMFSQTVMFEYPRQGIYSIGFVTSEKVSDKICDMVGQDLVAVFLATTPNPTSGFFLMVPRKDCIFLDIGVDDAMKIIISGGTIQPKNIGIKSIAQKNF